MSQEDLLKVVADYNANPKVRVSHNLVAVAFKSCRQCLILVPGLLWSVEEEHTRSSSSHSSRRSDSTDSTAVWCTYCGGRGGCPPPLHIHTWSSSFHVCLRCCVNPHYHPTPQVDGILVQLPLPKHINEQTVLDAISLDKDVDGFHPTNIGSLAMRGRQPLFVSCTPKVCATCAYHACIMAPSASGCRVK